MKMDLPEMTVRQALEWAYRDELPKDQTVLDPSARIACGPRGPVSMGAMLEGSGGADYRPNGFGLVRAVSGDAPHPDAVALARALRRACEKVAGDGRHPLHENLFPAQVDPNDALACIGRHVAVYCDADQLMAVCISCAVQRCAPVTFDEVDVGLHTSNGRPVWFLRTTRPVYAAGEIVAEEFIEVEGWDHRARRPKPGAYTKTRYEPALHDLAEDHRRYELWESVLTAIVADSELDEDLKVLVVNPTGEERRPWIRHGLEKLQLTA